MNISLSNWWSWGILLLLLMIVAVVDSRKRIPRKISIFILVPVLSVVIIFMMSENNKEADQSFHTLEEAVTAYDDRSDVVATLRGKTSALVIMDDGDVMDSQIFEKTESGWKLPEDSEFQDTKRFTGDRIIVDVSTVAVDGEWYVVVSPYPGMKYPITNVYDSEGTEFSEAKGSENVYYGYLKKYPEDYWVSASGQKMVPIGILKDWVRAMKKILLDGK